MSATTPLLKRYNALMFLSAILGVMAFLTADDKTVFLLPALVLIGVAWWAARRARAAGARWALPPMVVNLLVFGVIVNAALRTAAGTVGEPVVSTLGGFLVFVLLIKVFDRRSSRDDAQLLTLSVFVVIAAVLTSNTLVVGLIVAMFTPTAVATAMLWQVQAGQDRALAASGGESRSLGAAAAARDRAAVRGFRIVCALAVVSSSVLATGVFVLTPRGIGGDALGRFGVTRERQIGFREEVRLGEAGLLSPNPTPVMDVEVSMVDGSNAGTSQQVLYLRGGGRDKYNPETMVWEDSTPVIATGDPIKPDIRWLLPVSELDAGGLKGRSTMQSMNRTSGVRLVKVSMRSVPTGGNLFGLWRPIDVLSDQKLVLGYSPLNRTIRRVEASVGRLNYTIRSILSEEPAHRPEIALGFSEGRIRAETERVLELKKIATPAERSSRTAVTAIRDHLRDACSYTTEMIAPPSGQDAIEYFLFESKRGHCEYFASAMAAMCQSVGIPARVAVGYVATEYNPLSAQYLVRESNAHAWVEAFVITDAEENLGRWETFDPSPPGDIERIHRPQSGMFASLRGWYEALEFRWSSSVVGFDTIRQGKLFGREPGDAGRAASQIEGLADRLMRWMRNRSRPKNPERDAGPGWTATLSATMPWVLGAGAVGLGAYSAWRAWNRRQGRALGGTLDAEMSRLLRQADFYPAALRVLQRFGKGKPRGKPPIEHAHRLAKADPAVARGLSELAGLYYIVRFGRRALSRDEERRARALLDELTAGLRASGR